MRRIFAIVLLFIFCNVFVTANAELLTENKAYDGELLSVAWEQVNQYESAIKGYHADAASGYASEVFTVLSEVDYANPQVIVVYEPVIDVQYSGFEESTLKKEEVFGLMQTTAFSAANRANAFFENYVANRLEWTSVYGMVKRPIEKGIAFVVFFYSEYEPAIVVAFASADDGTVLTKTTAMYSENTYNQWSVFNSTIFDEFGIEGFNRVVIKK